MIHLKDALPYFSGCMHGPYIYSQAIGAGCGIIIAPQSRDPRNHTRRRGLFTAAPLARNYAAAKLFTAALLAENYATTDCSHELHHRQGIMPHG